jgi:hypothetical protein
MPPNNPKKIKFLKFMCPILKNSLAGHTQLKQDFIWQITHYLLKKIILLNCCTSPAPSTGHVTILPSVVGSLMDGSSCLLTMTGGPYRLE